MEKVIRKGKVAILISPGYGWGWYTWNTDHKELLFSPKLVKMVEQKKADKITNSWILKNLGLKDVCTGGAGDLIIHWLEEGTVFKVDEYGGSESLITCEKLTLVA